MPARPTLSIEHARVFGPAVVLSSTPDGQCQVVLENAQGRNATAQIPESLLHRARPGDRLLVAGNEADTLYVISVLESTRLSDESGSAEMACPLVASNGASASLTEDGHTLQINDSSGTLLFEYDGLSKKAKLSTPVDLELAGSRSLNFTSKGPISFQSPEFSLRTERARLQVEDLNYEGHAVRASLQRMRLVVSRMETVARTIVSRAVNVFAKVQELSQLRTGKRRVLTEQEYYLRCDKAALRSRKEFKVDGERIELG